MVVRNQNELKEKKVFIILGMHRSGTSMVAGMLHKSGICMGEHFRKPLSQNPKGFFEEEFFRQVNDILLNKAGYNVKEWNTGFSGVKADEETILLINKVINYFNYSFNSWGWKDPRTCLTINIWLKALYNANLISKTNIIIVNRSVKAVAKSLIKRGNIMDMYRGEKLHEMYNHYLHKGLLEYLNQLRILEVDYENLIMGKDLDKLESFCNIKINRSFIDSSLNHAD